MITFELVTPEGLKFQEDVFELLLPTPKGQIGILPHHMPLISIISPGVISIRKRQDDSDQTMENMATSGGFLEVSEKKVRLLADTAERAEDIDELKALEALERAKEMRDTAKDQVSLAEATSIIEQSTARLRVAELKKRRRSSFTRGGDIS